MHLIERIENLLSYHFKFLFVRSTRRNGKKIYEQIRY